MRHNGKARSKRRGSGGAGARAEGTTAPAGAVGLPESERRGLLAEAPFLLALFLAPLVAGYQDPEPPLWLACLVWLSVLLRGALPGGPPLRAPRVKWLVLAFPLLAAVSFVYSITPGATVLQAVLYASYAAALWLGADIAARGGAARVLGTLAAGALVAAGLGLQEYGFHLRSGDATWRAFGRFTNPNFFAAYLGPSLLVVFGLALGRPESFNPSTWLLALGLLTGALGGALMATGSRGGLLSLGAGLAVFVLLLLVRRAWRDWETLMRLGILVLVLAGVCGALSTGLRSRQQGTARALLPRELCPGAEQGYTADSNRFRVLTWRASLNMGRQRPLTGWGAGTFETAFAPHAIAGFTRHAHNGYLQLFAEQGAPAVLLWLAILAAGLAPVWSALRRPGCEWTAGCAAALVAAACHNVFDSTLFVPAVALLTWALLGTLGSASDECRVSNGEPGLSAEVAARAPERTRRSSFVARTSLAVAGLALSACQATGRMLLGQARGQVAQRPGEALSLLDTAAALLPWDHQVAVAQSQAYTYQMRLDDAIAAARRAVNLAPERPPGYYHLGKLIEYGGDKNLALSQYDLGLKHAPNEVQLLHARARVLEAQGRRAAALEMYRRILQVEESPVGQVRALGEVRDYRFARARIEVARSTTEPGAALEHRRRAACSLAERRMLVDGNPATYVMLGEWEAGTERDLRRDEALLWGQLAGEYRREGDARRAQLCQEQVTAVNESLPRLEEIIRDFR